jgi:hypothetical protein
VGRARVSISLRQFGSYCFGRRAFQFLDDSKQVGAIRFFRLPKSYGAWDTAMPFWALAVPSKSLENVFNRQE